MSGKNQHFIPQFLQRGFINIDKTKKGFDKNLKSTKEKQAQVWIFEKEKQPYLTNVRNKGAERFFYGPEDSAVDKTITEAETKYGRVVNLLREHTLDTSLNDPLIPELIVHLFVRTKHFRASVEELCHLGLNMIQGLFNAPEDFVQYSSGYFQQNPNKLLEEIDKKISKFSPAQQRIVRKEIQRNPSLLSSAINKVFVEMDHLHPTVMQSLSSLKNDLPDISKNAHIKSLSESIAPEKRVEQLCSLNWFLCVQSPGSYILGDAGSLYSTSNAQYNLLLSAEEDLQYVLLPISSQHLLIGSTDSPITTPDVETINQSSAALSRDFFIASQNTEQENLYAQQIGTKNSVLSKEHLSSTESDLRKEWFGK